jgi:RNA polymerase sigma-70 factor (ECF subfamily)
MGEVISMVGAWAGREGEGHAAHDGDVGLAARAAAGDLEAQSSLLRRVLARVRRVARALTSTASDADDVAQTALVAVLRSAGGYRGEAKLEAWAKRIAVRVALRHAAQVRRGGDMERISEVDLPAASDESRADALPRDVRRYLEALPEAQRVAIVLHHALEHSVGEIAELTSASPDTVKGRLRLGGAALRKMVRRDLASRARRAP